MAEPATLAQLLGGARSINGVEDEAPSGGLSKILIGGDAYQPSWGGLKSYFPNQPDWMKTAQQLVGHGIQAVPPEVALAASFLNPSVKGLVGSSLTRRLDALPQVPMRDVLPGDVSLMKHKMEVNLGDTSREAWNATHAGNEGVWASVSPELKMAVISSSGIAAPQRNAGIGIAAYQRLIDEAHRLGYIVNSDSSVSASAQRVYSALKDRGYDVRQHPDATDVGGQGRLRTPGDIAPVYTVGPVSPLGEK